MFYPCHGIHESRNSRGKVLWFRLSDAGQKYAESFEGNVAGFGTKATDELLKPVEPKALNCTVCAADMDPELHKLE